MKIKRLENRVKAENKLDAEKHAELAMLQKSFDSRMAQIIMISLERDEALKIIKKVRSIHTEFTNNRYDGSDYQACTCCEKDWPCDTIRALDEKQKLPENGDQLVIPAELVDEPVWVSDGYRVDLYSIEDEIGSIPRAVERIFQLEMEIDQLRENIAAAHLELDMQMGGKKGIVLSDIKNALNGIWTDGGTI